MYPDTGREALDDLLDQHAELRQIMDLCELLADQLDANQIEPAELTREVMRLRGTFDAHTRFEEEFLRPILREGDRFGPLLMDAVLAHHTREHRAMELRLAPGITAELRLTLVALRAHLDVEETHFAMSRR